MKKLKIATIVLLSVSFLVVSVWYLSDYFDKKPGGILVSSIPVSKVYINGKLVGKTPYETSINSDRALLRLIPDVDGQNFTSFEKEILLSQGTKTVVKHVFGEQDKDSGYIVNLEKGNSNESSLVIISDPANAQVSIDGVPRGFTPYKLNSLPQGEHTISIKSIGFDDLDLTANLIKGYRLSVVIDLGKSYELPAPEVASVKSEIKTFVEISDTPTGFLRVRTEPGNKGTEIYQVHPNDKYQFLEEDEASGWYKIQVQEPSSGLPDGIVGWVSNQYSKKIEEEVSN